MHRRLTAVSALFASMVDDERADPAPGREAAARWASDYEKLALALRSRRSSAEKTRIAATARLLADLRDELVPLAHAAGLDEGAFEQWIKVTFPSEVSTMPFLGHFIELLYERLRNADDKWEGNDLVDMHYLASATGYANVVVGERKTSELHTRARLRTPRGAFVCRTLPDAVAHLADLA
jgi:hypothetical protein